MASIDSGSAAPTTGMAEITATAVSLPASTRSRQYSAEKQSIGSSSPHAPCGKPVPQSPDSRKWVCTSTTTSVASAGSVDAVVVGDVVGGAVPCTVVVASSGSVAAVCGTLNTPPGSVPSDADFSSLHACRTARPDAMPGRREQEPAPRPPVPAGVQVGCGARPAHRLAAQVVERRRQVLAVRARPQLQRQSGIVVVTRTHDVIEPHAGGPAGASMAR